VITRALKVALAAMTAVLTSASISCSHDISAEREPWPSAAIRPREGRVDLTGLDELARTTAACREALRVRYEKEGQDRGQTAVASESTSGPWKGCVRVVYILSSVMPLSEIGVDNIAAATDTLDVPLTLIDGETLGDWVDESVQLQAEVRSAEASEIIGASTQALAFELVGAGASLHYPSIVIYDAQSRLVGPAILGFKTTQAYKEMIAVRLDRRNIVDDQNMGAGESLMGEEQGSSSPQGAERIPVIGLGQNRRSTGSDSRRDDKTMSWTWTMACAVWPLG